MLIKISVKVFAIEVTPGITLTFSTLVTIVILVELRIKTE